MNLAFSHSIDISSLQPGRLCCSCQRRSVGRVGSTAAFACDMSLLVRVDLQQTCLHIVVGCSLQASSSSSMSHVSFWDLADRTSSRCSSTSSSLTSRSFSQTITEPCGVGNTMDILLAIWSSPYFRTRWSRVSSFDHRPDFRIGISLFGLFNTPGTGPGSNDGVVHLTWTYSGPS